MTRLAEFQTRAEALAFLHDRLNFESRPPARSGPHRFKLDRMRRLLEALGDPHVDLPILHVAGSKGKGSVATMLAAGLEAAGQRSGLYTSPHLRRIEERFAVAGRPCSAKELVALVNQVRPAAERIAPLSASNDQVPTFFELTTAMALLHFRQTQVDAAILEVGLGGRLDSTNVCHPRVSVITSISRDHVRQLGHTTAQIATEKAGIIKRCVPVVTGATDPAALRVIEARAVEMEAPLYRMGHEFHVEEVRVTYQGTTCRYVGPPRATELPLSMLGAHQARNAAVALATLDLWRRTAPACSWERLVQGVRNARTHARVELLQRHPTVILDAAHNRASIDALLDTVEQLAPAGRRVALFATAADKEIESMLQLLLPAVDHLILTEFRQPARACPVRRLARLASAVSDAARQAAPQMEVEPDARRAWQRAVAAAARPDDLILVTGSFFLAAELADVLPAPPAASDG